MTLTAQRPGTCPRCIGRLRLGSFEWECYVCGYADYNEPERRSEGTER